MSSHPQKTESAPEPSAPAQNTLVITGSSGLIGSAFIEQIGPHYMEIGLDREGPPHPPPPTELVIPCDVGSDESVRDAFAEIHRRGHHRITSVIHLAAYYDFSGEPSPLYENVTVQGTRRLLHALRDFEVEQFIFTSTMLVHRPCEPGERIDENWPLEPKWDYPKSKVRTEELILAERGNIPVVLLRAAGVYDDLCHSVPIAHQIQRIHEKQLTARMFSGDIRRGQAFVHLDDLVSALARTIECRAQLPLVTTLLIGESETVSYETLQRTISRLLHGEEWDTREIPKPIAKAGAAVQDALPGVDSFIKPWMIDLADDHYALNIDRARQLLDWKPKHSLEATLPHMIAALRDDPERWYRENKLKK